MKQKLFHIVIAAFIGLISYSSTFDVPFFFDDEFAIVRNPIIRDLDFFTGKSEAGQYNELFEYETFKRRYVAYLTFALNYKFHGFDVTGYHIVNLLIHIINSCLVYGFIVISFRTPFLNASTLRKRSGQLALMVSLLFITHPLQTQAVTYIWQRVTSLAAMFYLLSLTMYVQARLSFRSSGNQKIISAKGGILRPLLYYLISFVSAVTAMKTKEIAFTLPVILVLYEMAFLDGDLKRRVFYLLPLMLTMLIIPLSLTDMGGQSENLLRDTFEAARAETDMSRFDYLVTEFRVLVTYIRLFFLPVNQNLLYDYPVYRSFFNPEVFLSFLFLSLFFGAGIYLWQRYRNRATHTRMIAFGIFWFFITLSVESSFFPIKDVIFEHRMYLPSIGIIIATSVLIIMLIQRMKGRGKNLAAVFVSILIISFAWASYERNTVWKSKISMWEDVVEKSPDIALPRLNLAKSYMDSGMKEKAFNTYKAAIQLNPNYDFPYYNLGNMMKESGKYYEALDYYRTALRLNPDFFPAQNNIAIVYKDLGKYSQAIEHFRYALKLKPYRADTRVNLGIAYRHNRMFKEAAEQFEFALKSDPDNPMIHLNLGAVYEEMKMYDKAKKHYAVVNNTLR